MARASSRPFRKPKGRYSQALRLTKLYDRLHGGGILHAGRLAEDFGVTRRTIERDLAVLHEVLGNRIEYGETPEPGWRWALRQRKWATTRWQVLAVAVGARMAGFLSGKRFQTHVVSLLEQLRGSLPQFQGYQMRRLEKKIHVVESGHKLYRDNPELQRRLGVMLDGLLLDRPVDLTYLSTASRRAGTPPKAMRVHVLAVVLHRASVYFIVKLLGEQTGAPVARPRLLALDRIPGATLDRDAEALEVPRGFDAAEFLSSAFAIWTGDGDHHVKLDIRGSYAPFVAERSWHPTQRTKKLPNGGLRLEMQLSDLREVAQWIVGMGPDARVVGPPALKKLVREQLEQGLAQYA